MAQDTPEPALPLSRRMELAYLTVFGAPEARSADQKLVMAHLEAECFAYRLSCQGMTGGELTQVRTYFNEGKRSVWLLIRGQVIKALSPQRPPPVSRRKSNP